MNNSYGNLRIIGSNGLIYQNANLILSDYGLKTHKIKFNNSQIICILGDRERIKEVLSVKNKKYSLDQSFTLSSFVSTHPEGKLMVLLWYTYTTSDEPLIHL